MSTEVVNREAYHIMNGEAARQAMEDTRTALYRRWIDAESLEEREKLHGVAQGAEFYWKVMEKYARDGKAIVEGLDEYVERAIRAVD